MISRHFPSPPPSPSCLSFIMRGPSPNCGPKSVAKGEKSAPETMGQRGRGESCEQITIKSGRVSDPFKLAAHKCCCCFCWPKQQLVCCTGDARARPARDQSLRWRKRRKALGLGRAQGNSLQAESAQLRLPTSGQTLAASKANWLRRFFFPLLLPPPPPVQDNDGEASQRASVLAVVQTKRNETRATLLGCKAPRIHLLLSES